MQLPIQMVSVKKIVHLPAFNYSSTMIEAIAELQTRANGILTPFLIKRVSMKEGGCKYTLVSSKQSLPFWAAQLRQRNAQTNQEKLDTETVPCIILDDGLTLTQIIALQEMLLVS